MRRASSNDRQSRGEKHGVELDANRAAAAAASGINTIHGDLFNAIAKVETFSFLYLNPPYDSEMGSINNRRMEFLFLEHTYRWLVEGGVLLMVVPQGRLDSSIPLLAENFADVRVYRHLVQDTRELAWATLVSFLGLPADPRWSGPILEGMWAERTIQRLDGIGFAPAAIHGPRDELLARIGRARSLGLLPFPEKNGPVLWPRSTIRQALKAPSLALTSDATAMATT